MWPIHAILMGVSFLGMLAGVIIRLTAKKQKWWYKTHHGLGYLGAIGAAAAIILAIIMISLTHDIHLGTFHSIIGAVTLFFIFASFIIILFFKVAKKEAKKGIRITHRVVGWITFPLMIVTIILGMQIAGLI